MSSISEFDSRSTGCPRKRNSPRMDALADHDRVAGRLNFREDNRLVAWVKAEVARRFNHACCADVARLKAVDYGITREGLIRDGPSRHTKDDRRAVNDATNYVLGWSLEGKIKALTDAFQQVERKVVAASVRAAEAEKQTKALDAQLGSVAGVLAVTSFADIDIRTGSGGDGPDESGETRPGGQFRETQGAQGAAACGRAAS
jgi:uncharacterized protein YPO0396